MEITFDLPEDLLREAMLVTNAASEAEVITLALQDIVRKSELLELKKYKGKIDLTTLKTDQSDLE